MWHLRLLRLRWRADLCGADNGARLNTSAAASDQSEDRSVAMHVLDPLEVAELEVWPFWQFQGINARTEANAWKEAKRVMNDAESVRLSEGHHRVSDRQSSQ